MPQPSPAARHSRERAAGALRGLITTLLVLAAGSASAQWTGAIGVASDYRHRGVSFSDRRPAAQGSIAYDHASGLFAGAQATTVRIGPPTAGTNLEFLVYGGFAKNAGPVSLEAGVLRYDYSGTQRVQEYGYGEMFVGITHGGLSAKVFRSNVHYENRGGSWYGQVAYAGALSDDVQFFLQAGTLWLAASDHGYPSPSVRHSDARIGIQTLWRGFQFELALAGTDRSSDDCHGALRRCEIGPVVSISRPLP